MPLTISGRAYSLSRLVFRRENNFHLVFCTQTEEVYTSNETAYLVLDRIQTGSDVPDICAALVQEYGISPAYAEKEVSNFLSQLISRKLLKEDNHHGNEEI